jgi:DNA polymerase-3 subunit epsilon
MTDTSTRADTTIVLDFETTGLSPDQGDRAIEIGAVKLVDGKVVETFQKLMYPGRRIDSFIEDYTGITNSMLRSAPPCEEVMCEFSDFISGYNLVAHNASFDSKFLDAELSRCNKGRREEFACSMLIARRLYQEAPNHKLGTLVKYKNLPNDGTFHRALADSQMTAHLWLEMISDIKSNHTFENLPFSAMQKISQLNKNSVSAYLTREASSTN